MLQQIVKQTEYALSTGALHSIPTTTDYFQQAGINFIVRISANIERKIVASLKQQQKGINPFLPYEEDLFVTHLSETHVCILNKFNVLDNHILIITKAFEDQDSLLTLEDFAALWICLNQIEGLGFYNGGKLAGSSQKHKHLQFVPLPLSLEQPSIPVETVINSALKTEGITTNLNLPFVQFIIYFEQDKLQLEPAHYLLQCYQTLLKAVGGGAYNLLATSRWMLLVPRSQEDSLKISINSLGFAGCFFVRNDSQFQKLKEYGPINLLKDVGYSLKGT